MQRSAKRCTIGDVAATIFTGVVLARHRDKPSSKPMKVLQARDVGVSLSPLGGLEEIALPPDAEVERSRLRVSDVVATARGIEVRTGIAMTEHDGVVAGPNLIVIRPGPNVIAELLAAFLRHPRTQASLLATRTGTGTAGFTVRQLTNLSLMLPDIDSQRLLSKLAASTNEYFLAAMTATELRRDAINDLIYDTLHQGTPTGGLE